MGRQRKKFKNEREFKNTAANSTTNSSEETALGDDQDNVGTEPPKKRTRSQGRHSTVTTPIKSLAQGEMVEDERIVKDKKEEERSSQKDATPKKKATTPKKKKLDFKNVNPLSKKQDKQVSNQAKVDSETDGEIEDSDSDTGTSTENSTEEELDSEIEMSINPSGDEFLDHDYDESQYATPEKRKKESFRSRSRSKSKSPRRRRREKKRSRSRSRSRRKDGKRRKARRRRDSDYSDFSDDEKVSRIIKLVREQLKNEGKGNKLIPFEDETDKGGQNFSKGKNKEIRGKDDSPIIKSPSESALYVPALQKNLIPRSEAIKKSLVQTNVEKEVLEHLKNIRIVTGGSERSTGEETKGSTPTHRQSERSDGATRRKLTGRDVADDLILQAERHKASIAPKTGNYEEVLDRVDPSNMNHLQDDSTFLHSTCHVDSVLRAKIQRGEYVELEKLLMRPKSFKNPTSTGKDRLSLVNNNGIAEFEVPGEQVRINSVRRWEQGFRIYATIYSQANPTRAHELLHYIATINNAARSYTWDCVAYYDFQFRQLMARKPNRSWALTFPELWNLALTEPLNKSSSNYNNNAGSGKKRDWRDNSCWRFNKGHCKHGPYCRYDHRCSYCGSASHPAINCSKNPRRKERNERDRHERQDKYEKGENQGRKDRKKHFRGEDEVGDK